MRKLFTTALLSVIGFTGFSQVEADSSKFSLSGYVDAYYMANFNGPTDRSNLGVSGMERAFDRYSNQFSLGLAQTKLSYAATSNSEVVIDLVFGPNADLGNYGNVIGNLGDGVTSTSLAIKQAYINFGLGEKASFTIGQFGTHIGYEVIDAPANFNYSLSNLFNNGPFYHIGAKLDLPVSDRAAFMVGLVNNIDGLNDNNSGKGVISQIYVSPADDWNLYLNGMVSDESAPGSTGSYSIIDLTTGYQITDKYYLGLNSAFGSASGDYQGGGDIGSNKTWGGAAIYSNYAFSDSFALGGRYEYFDNTSGARALTGPDGVGTSVNSFTVTGNITSANGHLLIKPEIRIDSYATNNFVNSKGEATNSQATFGLHFIYSY